MKADVWVPIYIGDYLADTTRLTTEQHGAYFLLILDYWRNGPPPDDDVVLAQITKCSEHAWSILRAALIGYFRVADGVWRHKRIDAELASAKDKKTAAKSKAKVAAEARWAAREHAPSNAPSNAPSIAQALLEQCPSPSPSQEEHSDPIGSVLPPPLPNCPAEELVALYHERLPLNPRCAALNDARRGAMRARWRFWAGKGKYSTKADGLAWWSRFFDFSAKSPFLTGQARAREGRPPFVADIDFLFAPKSNISIVEGKYHEEAAT